MTDRSELLRQLSIPAAERTARANPWPWIVGLIALAIGSYFLYSWLQRGPTGTLVGIATASSASQTAGSGAVLDGSGYVVARRQATVSAKSTGKLLEVLLEEGMEVQAGQVLARLEPVNVEAQRNLALAQLSSAGARVKESEIALAQAERELKRQADLIQRKLTSQQALDQARANVDGLRARVNAGRSEINVANASLRAVEQELDDLTVRAPFAGRVVAKAAQPGEIVSPISAGGGFTRTGIGTIVDMNSLEVEIDVSESNIQKVRAEQPAEILLNAYPDTPIAGRVIAIIPTADRTKATVKVRVGFVARDERALPEMGARVRFMQDIDAAPKAPVTGVLLPQDAVINDTVFLLDQGVLRARSVVVAERIGGSVRIASGISAGEQFAIPKDGATLRDGLVVRTQ
jgi:HlyD family secretion protein